MRYVRRPDAITAALRVTDVSDRLSRRFRRCYGWNWYSLGKITLLNPQWERGGGEKQLRFNCKLSRSHMFGEKGFKLTTTRRTGLVLETCLSLLTLTFVAYIRD